MEKDLQSTEAIKKLKSLVEDIRFCMYTTYENGKIESRPMTTLEVDEEGNAWFFTNKNTELGKDTGSGEDVTLIYSHPGDNTYLSVTGHATIVEDDQKKEELWSPLSKAWFPQGKEDPNLVILKVTTEEAAYWDSPSSKMVVFVSLIKAAVTGHPSDQGEHGKLNLA
jgi:general stress protein 26